MTKLRFEFTFDEVDPKLLRQVKGLKKKNKYNLKQAQALVLWLQKNWTQTTSVALVCNDKEEGNTYAFDEISVTPFNNGGREVSLFDEIESQILKVPEDVISDPSALLMAIDRQYQSESEVEEQPVPNKKRKGLPSISNPFKKEKGLSKTKESDQYQTEYELDSTPEYEEDNDTEKTEEKTEQAPEEVTSTQKPQEESFDFSDEEHEEGVTTSSQEAYPVSRADDFPVSTPNNYYPAPEQQVMNVQPVKKHETVNLLTLQEYCDVGEEINQSIAQLTEKLKHDSLFRFVGIPSAGLTNTRIDDYRSNFALLKLSEAKFENIREMYSREVNGLVAEALEKLKTAVVLVWNTPYDLKVKSDKRDILEAMEAEANKKIEEFIDLQTESLQDKEAKFEAEQETELQQFKAQQRANKKVFLAQEKERSQNLIDSKAETINLELEKSRESFIDEEMYKLKNDMNLNLFDGKRQIIQNLAVGVGEANEVAWNNALEAIKDIQLDIEVKTPLWASEITEFNILEEQEHQRNKDKKELELRKETLEIKRLETEINLKRQEELAHENKMLAIKLETAISKNELYEVEKKQNYQAKEFQDTKQSPLSLLSGSRFVGRK